MPSLYLTPTFSFELRFHICSASMITTQKANACSPWTPCLILITSVGKKYFNILKINRNIKDFRLLLVWKNCKEKLFILCTNNIKTLAWHNAETKCHLNMKFCTDRHFYETFYLKINWNLDSALLSKKVSR